MDSHITLPYQIADHHCMIKWVYNKIYDFFNESNECIEVLNVFDQIVF